MYVIPCRDRSLRNDKHTRIEQKERPHLESAYLALLVFAILLEVRRVFKALDVGFKIQHL